MISPKQKKILAFPYTHYDALICDGAVRSGKTSIMSVAFVLWMMRTFSSCSFAWCGKSVGAVERNIIQPLLSVAWLRERYAMIYRRGEHLLRIRAGTAENRVYLFGGKDESSYALIQGMTLAGVLLDEVALMPRSFVEQALARCSVEGARFWFNCNPETPMHWFHQEWILRAGEKNALHLHFTMDDNPALSEAKKEQYRRMYRGAFYDRYILGLWRAAEGVIYSMFDSDADCYDDAPAGRFSLSDKAVSVDYGTHNPTVFLESWDDGEVLWIDREYRWDSREQQRQKTDAEYADDLLEFLGEPWCPVYVDPSAASFIAELRRRGVYVVPADNTVLDGIRRVCALMGAHRLRIARRCTGLLQELETYIWDAAAAAHGDERPVKQFDHACDALRYRVNALPDWRFE